MTRDEILDEIRRTAAANGGVPLGRGRLEQVTGITEYDVGRYWARYGDAVREAGFDPNVLNPSLSEEFVIAKYLGLVTKLGHVPTRPEMRLERQSHDPTFPSVNVYARFGRKADLIDKALDYCRRSGSHPEALALLESAKEARLPRPAEESRESVGYGFVYLVEGHRGEYKIGRTNLVDRRMAELGATAAVEYQLVHEIKTDDPVGVEAYWHKRFAERRMRGEWFALTSGDVKAFKRWRRVY
jgi:hypothetical protein